jgi:hypothetical protein
MFKNTFPIELKVDGHLAGGVITLSNADLFLRYDRLPGYPAVVPKFVTDPDNPSVAPNANVSPWTIADVFPTLSTAPSRIFKLSLAGSTVDMSSPTDKVALALLDEESLDLELYMGVLTVPHRPSLDVVTCIHLALKLNLC